MELLESDVIEGCLWQRVRLDAGDGQPLHRHKTWQVITVKSGAIEMDDGERIDRVKFLRTGEAHGFTALAETELWMLWGSLEPQMEVVVP